MYTRWSSSAKTWLSHLYVMKSWQMSKTTPFDLMTLTIDPKGHCYICFTIVGLYGCTCQKLTPCTPRLKK